MESLQASFKFLKSFIVVENTPDPPPPKTYLEIALSGGVRSVWKKSFESIVTCPIWVWEGLVTLSVAYVLYRIIITKQPRIVTHMRQSLNQVWPMRVGVVAIQNQE